MADSRRQLLIGALLATLGIGAQAAEEGDLLLDPLLVPRSYVTVEAGADSAGSHDASADLDLATAAGNRLRFFAGTSRLEAEHDRIGVHTLRVGLASNPLNPIAFEGEYEWWGNRDDIEIGAWRLGVTWSGTQWSTRLLAEVRDIRLFTRAVLAPFIPHVDFDSDAWALALTYHASAAWDVTVRRREIDYSVPVSKLSTSRLAPYVFTATAFGLGSGLLASRTGLETVHYLDFGSLGFEWERTDSAVDGTHSYLLAVNSSLLLDDDWSLLVRVGQFDAAGGGDTVFGSLGLSYAW